MPDQGPVVRVRLGGAEAELLGRLAAANPGYLQVSDCDAVTLGNLVAVGAANGGGRRVWISAFGLALWDSRPPR